MSIPGASLTNLLLLLELPSRPGIGHAGLESSPLLQALPTQTDRLVDLGSSSSPPAHASLDVAIVRGSIQAHYLRALRSGGWLVLLSDRPRSEPTFRPILRRAAEVRSWLVGPDLSMPHAVVPRTRSALRAHEIVTREPGWKRALLLAAIWLGWTTRSFGGEIIAMRVP